MSLVLGSQDFGDSAGVVMAIVNRTPDSFYDGGATYDEGAALDRVAQVVAEGADIVDIGGVKAGYGDEVDGSRGAPAYRLLRRARSAATSPTW